jgi:hypothetical protein
MYHSQTLNNVFEFSLMHFTLGEFRTTVGAHELHSFPTNLQVTYA